MNNEQASHDIETRLKTRRFAIMFRIVLTLLTLGSALGVSLAVTGSQAGAAVNTLFGTDAVAYPGDGCSMLIGDQYSSYHVAIGEADVSCPTDRVLRLRVYLDYWNGSSTVTVKENVAGTAYYTNYLPIATPYACGLSGSWYEYAQVSIDGGPYHGYWNNWHGFSAAAC